MLQRRVVRLRVTYPVQLVRLLQKAVILTLIDHEIKLFLGAERIIR